MEDLLEDADGEATALLRLARVDPAEPTSINELAFRLLGSRPSYVRMVGRGDLWRFKERWVLRVHKMLPPAKQREVVAHEIAEWRANTTERHFNSLGEREAWCNAVGARLLCPSTAFRLGVRAHGHSPTRLATAFGSSSALALLRIGEVTGRPVLLLGPQPIARGSAFSWPAKPTSTVRGAHPVRLGDRIGLMVEREVWAELAA